MCALQAERAAAAGASEQEPVEAAVGESSEQGALWAVDLSVMGREGGERVGILVVELGPVFYCSLQRGAGDVRRKEVLLFLLGGVRTG